MENIKISKFVAVVFLLVLTVTAGYYYKHTNFSIGALNDEKEIIIPEVQDGKEIMQIEDKETFGFLMDRAGISTTTYNEIYQVALDSYDLATIRVGKEIELTFEKESRDLKKLAYKINSEDEIVVVNKKYFDDLILENTWEAELKPIDYEVKININQGEVKTSMYEAALENSIDERVIIELANSFQWTIDFSMDPRVGDTFRFISEDRYLEGRYVMPGRILAGEYVNAGEKYEVYYFEEDEDNIGYFDSEANSVQKMFLKAPVSFKYISSGFTTGQRYVEAFNVSTGHRAVDYAAAQGTPIRSVGDGTVSFVGWNGSYGNMVKVRHNSTYSTNYGHMSRFAVSTGKKVKQGDIIGYVGSTGFSTGPHLHYEMVKNGAKVNPLREVLPPGEPIKEENKTRFYEEVNKWKEMLGG